MKHNKRNWNHFIGIETYTIMSKAQQMVQYDHEVLPPPFWTIEEKKKEKKRKRKCKKTKKGEKKGGERLGKMEGGK